MAEVFAKSEVKVWECRNLPSGFLNLVAGEHHVDARLYRIFHFNGQNSSMTMQVLGFTLEPIESVCVLQI